MDNLQAVHLFSEGTLIFGGLLFLYAVIRATVGSRASAYKPSNREDHWPL